MVETPEEPSKKVYKKRDDAAKAAQKKAKGLSRETGREYAYAVYEPVSYTHLDVYTRQPLHSTRGLYKLPYE